MQNLEHVVEAHDGGHGLCYYLLGLSVVQFFLAIALSFMSSACIWAFFCPKLQLAHVMLN